jgi:hypothetical protein
VSDRSLANSLRVRSRPPGAITSISRSSKNGSVPIVNYRFQEVGIAPGGNTLEETTTHGLCPIHYPIVYEYTSRMVNHMRQIE